MSIKVIGIILIVALLTLYITTLPVIISRVITTIFINTKIVKEKGKPIDRGKILKDGERLFGDNITNIDILLMLYLSSITYCIWGVILPSTHLFSFNIFYVRYTNNFIHNFMIGGLFGISYIIRLLLVEYINLRFPNKKICSKFKKIIKNGILSIIFTFVPAFLIMIIITSLSEMSSVEMCVYSLLLGLTDAIINGIFKILKLEKVL